MTAQRRPEWAEWLPWVITLGSIILVAALGALLASSSPSPVALGLVLAGPFVASGGLQWVLGASVDRRWTAGPVVHDRHPVLTFRASAVQELVLGLAVFVMAAGHLTTIRAGVAPLAGAVGAGGFLWLWRAGRRQERPIGDRRDLARERGWRYDASDTGLQIWWGARAAGDAGDTTRPFGIVTGEVHRLPFTGFDTATPDGRITTHWVVELPEAFPPIAVCEPGAEGVTAADPAFAAALATPGVIEETAAHDLWGWRIDGRDLILSRPYTDAPCPAAELAAVAEGLAALYYRFPLDAVRRFGGTVDAPTPLPRPPPALDITDG